MSNTERNNTVFIRGHEIYIPDLHNDENDPEIRRALLIEELTNRRVESHSTQEYRRGYTIPPLLEI